MYTEAEAKTKWCPLARPTVYSENHISAAGNLDVDGDPAGFCLASGCMAWRIAPSFGKDMADAKDHLAADKLIEAIRSWRAATGEGLHESKVALEQIRLGKRKWPSTEGKGFCGAFGPAMAGAA